MAVWKSILGLLGFTNGSSPGEWFNQHTGFRKVGLILHLGTILPCGILVIYQFIPSIRHRVILFHRINGYIIVVLLLISNAGAPCSTWGSIMTIHPLLEIISRIVSKLGTYYEVWPCEKIDFTWQFYKIPVSYLAAYPMCAPLPDPAKLLPGYDPVAIVKADDNGMEPAQIGANLNLSFGLALWLALFLHIFGVEIYLQLTPRESQRLRMVSYERQKAAGYANPGLRRLKLGSPCRLLV
ncbi:hypothetical protein RJZ56_002592 [Blastomyces dermatitidis]